MSRTALLSRLVVVVIAEVEPAEHVGMAWAAGPLPMRWRVGTPKEVVSTARGRSYYLNDGLERCLYRRDNAAVRWHSAARPVPVPGHPGAWFAAAEVLLLPDLGGVTGRQGLCAVHVVARDITVEAAEALVYAASNLNSGHGAGMRAAFDGLLRGGARLSPQARRAWTVSFAAPRSRLTKPYPRPRFADTDPARQWLHLLANQARVPPSPEALRAADADIAVSEDYRVRVDPLGVALVATRPATHPANAAVHEAVEFFARGLHTDLLLFGAGQAVLLRHLSFHTTQALMGAASAAEVDRMRAATLWFRRLYVRGDFAPQPPYDQVLRAFTSAIEATAALERVQKDIDDLAGRLQARLSAQTNALLGLIAVAGLPTTVSVAVWQDMRPDKLGWLFVAFGVAAVVSLLLLLTGRGRTLLRDLRPSGRRRGRRR